MPSIVNHWQNFDQKSRYILSCTGIRQRNSVLQQDTVKLKPLHSDRNPALLSVLFYHRIFLCDKVYWRCRHSMRRRVYVTVGCPSVRLSVCPINSLSIHSYRRRQIAAASGQRKFCDPRRIDTHLYVQHNCDRPFFTGSNRESYLRRIMKHTRWLSFYAVPHGLIDCYELSVNEKWIYSCIELYYKNKTSLCWASSLGSQHDATRICC